MRNQYRIDNLQHAEFLTIEVFWVNFVIKCRKKKKIKIAETLKCFEKENKVIMVLTKIFKKIFDEKFFH